MEVGGWVQVSLGIFWLLFENRPKLVHPQNSPKPVLIFWSSRRSIPRVRPNMSVYIAKSCWLLWFECSIHVSDGFPKKFGWVGGWGELRYPNMFWIFGICLTLQSPQRFFGDTVVSGDVPMVYHSGFFSSTLCMSVLLCVRLPRISIYLGLIFKLL